MTCVRFLLSTTRFHRRRFTALTTLLLLLSIACVSGSPKKLGSSSATSSEDTSTILLDNESIFAGSKHSKELALTKPEGKTCTMEVQTVGDLGKGAQGRERYKYGYAMCW